MKEVDYEGRGVGITFFSHIYWCKIRTQPLKLYHQSIFINTVSIGLCSLIFIT